MINWTQRTLWILRLSRSMHGEHSWGSLHQAATEWERRHK